VGANVGFVISGPNPLGARLATLLLACGVVACGGGGGSDGGAGGSGDAGDGPVATSTVACTIRSGTGNPPTVRTTCLETSGVSAATADALGMSCVVPADAGTILEEAFAMGLCSRDQLVGGCRADNADGTVTTKWFYDDGTITADNVSAICQQLGEAFVSQ
jgi:hypothetical protein